MGCFRESELIHTRELVSFPDFDLHSVCFHLVLKDHSCQFDCSQFYSDSEILYIFGMARNNNVSRLQGFVYVDVFHLNDNNKSGIFKV